MTEPRRDIRCPGCGGACIAYGTRMTAAWRLDGTGIFPTMVEGRRYRCDKCKRMGTAGGGMPANVVEAVVMRVMFQGTVSAASSLGCHRSVVEKAFSEWMAKEEALLPATLPDAIGIRAFRAGNVDRIVVLDVTRETILEVFPDHAALKLWLSKTPGTPTLAVIEIDARVSTMLRGLFPRIELAVTRSVADPAILAAAVKSLDILVRNHAEDGRNFREDAALLGKADADLTEDETEELSMWDMAARRIRRIVLGLRAASGDTKAYATALSGVAASSGPDALVKLAATWGKAFVAGVKKTGPTHASLPRSLRRTRSSRCSRVPEPAC